LQELRGSGRHDVAPSQRLEVSARRRTTPSASAGAPATRGAASGG
jgi:hypothetical protein